MPDLTSKIVAILRTYVRDPSAPIESLTTLSDLEIDRMDLPMISLDIEDAVGVQIPYDEQIENLTTIHALVASVEALREAKAKRPPPSPRLKSNWLSTGAERRR
ncbi:MAG: acyl carrier protein [Hyphomicrobiaceae bacterium]